VRGWGAEQDRQEAAIAYGGGKGRARRGCGRVLLLRRARDWKGRGYDEGHRPAPQNFLVLSLLVEELGIARLKRACDHFVDPAIKCPLDDSEFPSENRRHAFSSTVQELRQEVERLKVGLRELRDSLGLQPSAEPSRRLADFVPHVETVTPWVSELKPRSSEMRQLAQDPTTRIQQSLSFPRKKANPTFFRGAQRKCLRGRNHHNYLDVSR
jgi:hypothetical protein